MARIPENPNGAYGRWFTACDGRTHHVLPVLVAIYAHGVWRGSRSELVRRQRTNAAAGKGAVR